MYENFLINFEASYMALWLEDRHNSRAIEGKEGRDAWNLNLAFVYSF